MQINRKNIFKKYAWLKEKKHPFIISADYDGLICASFLSHYLDWQLVGYYDFNSIWLSDISKIDKRAIIWVDLNILPKNGKSVGGHIVSIDKSIPQGFKSSCNPNILAQRTASNFDAKFPFSTLLFLFWLHNINYTKNDVGKLIILHSDNTWMKIQKYSNNIKNWQQILLDYNWQHLFSNIDSLNYEQKIDQLLYPKLIQLGAVSKFSKLTSKYLNIKSRECTFNPDWDGDIILNLFYLFADKLGWTPPNLPLISRRIEGHRSKVSLNHIKNIGLNNFIKSKKIFSYAITSPKNMNYTIFQSYTNNEK